uniref:Protein HOMOLOG OF MAMMALIAN LYST-INTERACTING PROTEIN 5 isoform X2 n=1 Tax=Elaeis guineensis var. tenera TaxID=51953 RepID=A0A8N4IC73_ELAGV|nr:protein HOMOLOG OF MAMMALIAN LYST-INTERACTING PROTEIN 5 isoform X2 [Elaeis guineensis]
MGSEAEPAKALLPYLQRADELQKHEPLVAYYCRLFAMERGLRIPQKERTKTTNALLVSLMNQLEKDKKSLKLGPEDYLYVEGFASNVFAKADKQDRAGRADLNTAKTFYAASIFFEILNQFGEIQPDIEQKQKYALWKAAEIRKALKEGRRPEPGPPGGDKDLLMPSSSPTNTYDPGRSESFPSSYPGADTSPQHVDKTNEHSPTHPHISPSSYSSNNYPSSELHQLPPTNRPEISSYPQAYHHQPYVSEQQPMPQNYHSPENPSPQYSYPNFQSYPSFHESSFPTAPTHQPSYYHGPDAAYSHQPAPSVSNYPSTGQYSSDSGNDHHVGSPAPSTSSYKYDSHYQPPVEKIAEAHKAARFAVGALAFDDVAVAVDHLRRSLELLTNPSAEIHST